jgi:Sec-independent protein secretion pathway component TatC
MLLLMVAGSVLVGWLGRHRRIGFLGFFIVSLLITPILGLLVLILSADDRVGKSAA